VITAWRLLQALGLPVRHHVVAALVLRRKAIAARPVTRIKKLVVLVAFVLIAVRALSLIVFSHLLAALIIVSGVAPLVIVRIPVLALIVISTLLNRVAPIAIAVVTLSQRSRAAQ
jgi:hypothetical protein